jgi:CBS domain-containing protein
VGVVTDRDIVVRGCVSSRPLDEQTAADVMTTDLECAHAEDSLVRLVERMARRGVRRLPVVGGHRRGARVLGIVAFDEVATHSLDDPELAEALERLAHRRRQPQPSARTAGRHWFLPALWRRLRG